jgi:hypothetical protein
LVSCATVDRWGCEIPAACSLENRDCVTAGRTVVHSGSAELKKCGGSDNIRDAVAIYVCDQHGGILIANGSDGTPLVEGTVTSSFRDREQAISAGLYRIEAAVSIGVSERQSNEAVD